MSTESQEDGFSEYDLASVANAFNKTISHDYLLDKITPEYLISSQKLELQGVYAPIQWLYEQVEKADTFLSACIDRREAALGKIPWDIRKKSKLDDVDDAIAESQLRTCLDFCNSIKNLNDAIVSMGQADFRGFKILQKFSDDTGNYLLPLNNWNIGRDGYQGEWLWNERASMGGIKGVPFPVPKSNLIIRELARPINTVCVPLILDRKNVKGTWFAFITRYGVPPLFVKMPKDLKGREAQAKWMRLVRMAISNASGVVPHDAEFVIPNSGNSNTPTFEALLNKTNEEIVFRSTGSILTMLTAPGAGTNTATGSSHEKSSNEIVSTSANDIANVLTRQLIDEVIDSYHPGQPKLVEFILENPAASESEKKIQEVAVLRSSGWKVNQEQLEEVTGWNLEEVETATEQISDQRGESFINATPMLQRLNCIRDSLQNAKTEEKYYINWGPSLARFNSAIDHKIYRINALVGKLKTDQEKQKKEEQERLRDEKAQELIDKLTTRPTAEDIRATADGILPMINEVLPDYGT